MDDWLASTLWLWGGLWGAVAGPYLAWRLYHLVLDHLNDRMTPR